MWIDMLGIFVVNVGAVGLGLVMQRAGRLGRRAFFGYYLVLAPLGLQAWDKPFMWMSVAFAAAGLVVITISSRRSRA